MVFRRRSGIYPVDATKNVIDKSSIIAATTNTVLVTVAHAVNSASLATDNEVTRSSTINGLYLSLFIYSEGGEVANEVPLADWYIIKDSADHMGTAGFAATGLPTPGATGTHENKRYIFHTEKGLAGGGDASLSGVPMVFKGVIGIPRGFRRMAMGDKITIAIRTNFASKVCVQCIYKWYK